MTFELIDRYPIEFMCDFWKKILSNILMSENISQIMDIQINIYYYFLLSSILHNELFSITSYLKLPIIIDNLLYFKNRTRTISDREFAFFSIFLLYCRINEEIAQQFILLRNYKEGLLGIIEDDSKFSIFVHYFIWVLNPTTEFPIIGNSMKDLSNTSDILGHQPPPSYSFSSEISPTYLISSLSRLDTFVALLQSLFFYKTEIWSVNNKKSQYK